MRSVWPMLLHENGRPTVMVELMGQLMCDGKSGKQGSTDLCAQAGVHTRNVFHIHLTEDVGEELHAMVIINGHKLVVLLLSNLMADAFAVDDSGHAEQGIAFFVFLYLSFVITDRFDLDFINLYLSTMLAFTEPSFALIHFVKAVAIHMSNIAIFGLDNRLVVINKRL